MYGLHDCDGFEWDVGNSDKNWERHRVTQSECEQVFFYVPFLVAEDLGHSQEESRSYGLGKTDLNRRLFVVFTIRGSLIRVISARDMSRSERRVYQHAVEETDS